MLVFLAEWAFGIWLGYHKVLLGDAMSRTANAFYVLYSQPPRLTSMGMVWNPLPSVLQLPFVWLSQWWRPLLTKGISMSFVSALFAAWGVKALYASFHELRVQEKYALWTVVLYSLNPYIVFYGANGMTEIMMGSACIQVVCSMTRWMRRGEASNLLGIAFSFVVMFLIRYEAVPFGICIAIGMALHMLFSKRERKYYPQKKLEPLWYIEGTLWVTFLPVIYTALVWIYYNWSITGNPLYFMNSGYSMSAYSAYYTDYGGFFSVMKFVMARAWPFMIPVAGLVIAQLAIHRFRRYETAVMLLACLGLTAFTSVMIALGKSGGYVRYLCYPLMISVAFIPYVLASALGKLRSRAAGILAGCMLCTGLAFAWGFTSSSIFVEDLTLNVPAHSEQVAAFINARCRNGRVLMDSYRTYYAIMNTDRVDNLVISCSPDFEDCVADPVANNIRYVVVPQIGSYGNMDALNIAYPTLYHGGCSWAREIADIGEFKIFEVIR